MNRFDWIEFWASVTPEKVAAIDPCNGEKLSYALLNANACHLSAILQQQYNIKKNDRIIIVASNCFEYLYLFAAAQKIGICIVPLNYRLTKNEISKLVDESDAKLILYHSHYTHLIGDYSCKYELHSFFNTVLDTSSPGTYKPVSIDENDPIFILFTSGSSGYPKGVIYTHKMLFWNSINTQISLIITNETKTIICMPPFHTGGWNVLLTPLLHVGGTAIIMDKFDSKKILEYIAFYQCQIFMGVPTMLQMMRNEDCFDDINLTSLKYIIVGGEAMSVPLIEEYHNKGVLIRQGYGMTEVGPNLTSLHENHALNKIGSIGKPNMYVEIRIVNENSIIAKTGESGELWLNGPIVTPGYFNKESEHNEAFDQDGWFKTGDIVKMDSDGFLYIIDRIKNMYISGGENVYPAEVERTIRDHPDVHEVMIAGVPDTKWGEVGYAYVVGNQIDLSTLNDYCRENLSKYKIPKHFELTDSLLKTDSGKINRKLLKQKAIETIAKMIIPPKTSQ